ncbi:MAG: EFR1 family ferrodoxin [Treponema sp.]|nr:EFR1 family ferrodoxin [Treponema sp.]
MTKIYYFSGTGNSLWSAKKIAQTIGECELFNIGNEVQNSEISIEADTVVFVFPSYAYGLPLAVSRFVKNVIFKTPYLAAFVTYGSSPGGSLAALSRILKKKNINSLFFGRIPAVENYLAMFGPPKAKTLERRLSLQKKATEEAARCILERRVNRVNTVRPFSALVSLLFLLGIKIFYKHYRLSSECNGCGICEKLCPVSAIVMQSGRPVFTKKCEHCQGCVNICPLRAIQFGRVKHGTPGYRHPEISIDELARYEY